MALEIITSNKNKRIAGFSGRMFRVDEVKDESIRWRCLTTSSIGKQSAPAGPEHDNPIHHVLTVVLHAAVLKTAILHWPLFCIPLFWNRCFEHRYFDSRCYASKPIELAFQSKAHESETLKIDLFRPDSAKIYLIRRALVTSAVCCSNAQINWKQC